MILLPNFRERQQNENTGGIVNLPATEKEQND